MAKKKRTRWQRRPGTTGGKLPWNDWRNATTWRKATQLLLLAMNIYIAITFWYWVRYYETASSTTFVARPGGIEGWLPIAGLMNLKYSLATGQLPSVHAAAMLLLVAFIVISLLLKKAFCSWLCPVGTLSELIGALGNKLWSAMCPSPLAGYSSARRKVFAVEFFSLYRVIDARSGDSLFYVVALQRGDGR